MLVPREERVQQIDLPLVLAPFWALTTKRLPGTLRQLLTEVAFAALADRPTGVGFFEP